MGLRTLDHLYERANCGIRFGINIEAGVRKLPQKIFHQRDRLASHDTGARNSRIIQFPNYSALTGHAVEPVVMESNQYAVPSTVHICLKISVALRYRALKRGSSVFRRGLAIATMGESEHAIVLKKRVTRHLSASVGRIRVGHLIQNASGGLQRLRLASCTPSAVLAIKPHVLTACPDTDL